MQIFIARDNRKHGPFSLEAIQAALDAGELNGTDLAWYEGAPDWLPLAQVQGLTIAQGTAIPSSLPPNMSQSIVTDDRQVLNPSSPRVGCLSSIGGFLLCSFLTMLIAASLGDYSPLVIGLIVLSTSVWVYFDAKAIGVARGQMSGIANMGPGSWFAGCLLLWAVTFPIYLIARPEFKRINNC